MALIDIERLSTVFGPRPQAALQQVQGGLDKATLLARTGHTLALHDVSLCIEAGEIFVIMGLSGSGKSTLVRHINRLLEPTAGRVCIAGQDLGALSLDALVQLRRERLGMVFQRFALLPNRNVIDNVALPLELRGMARAQRHEQAERWLDAVGLHGVQAQMPMQLSGGMRQRVGLARALCAGTDIILMDEAFSALDPLIRARMQQQLLQLHAEFGRTIVFVTHDLDEALRLGHRVAVLEQGRLLQVASPADLLMHPAGAHVAAFVHDVNRARAWCVADALAPWPADLQAPPLAEAVDAELAIESVLPKLLDRCTLLAVRRGDRVVGQVDRQRVAAMLAPPQA